YRAKIRFTRQSNCPKGRTLYDAKSARSAHHLVNTAPAVRRPDCNCACGVEAADPRVRKECLTRLFRRGLAARMHF
ncbi:hypothetical protein, partial [Burkholderia glumae]|uniref:hypothetical protein n=1 Tax=Burkholderia glumae TaxID=337 RepID=UPI0020372D0D